MYYIPLRPKHISTTGIVVFVILVCISVYIFIDFSAKYVHRVDSSVNETDGFFPCDRQRLELFQRNSSETGQLSFLDTMKTFPWAKYNSSVVSQDTPEIRQLSTQLLLKLVPFLTRAPKIPSNDSCVAPPIRMRTLRGGKVCKPLRSPRKVGILWQFGFDVDALEIHLHELDDLVDKFFILESIQAHSIYISKKPLIWDLLKFDKRFSKFSEKIVHFVVDDTNLAKLDPGKYWSKEVQQELLRWTKFQEWNNAAKYFGDDDLLGFGDVDEVPFRDNINFLKSCEFEGDSVDIGIWFPLNGTDTVFMTDFPIKGHPYTLGDPTFWKLGSAKKYFSPPKKIPSRMRGTSQRYLLGGMHLSAYGYPPFQMTKLLTASEAKIEHKHDSDRLLKAGANFAQGRYQDARNFLGPDAETFRRKGRVEKLETFKKKSYAEAEAIVKMPWFLQCNRERYPSFENKYDPRLDL